MKKHYILFYTPNHWPALETWVEVEPHQAEDVEHAKKLAPTVVSFKGITPDSFEFVTRGRTDEELDSRIISRSCTYFLGGRKISVKDLRVESPQHFVLRHTLCDDDEVIVDTKYPRLLRVKDGDVLLVGAE